MFSPNFGSFKDLNYNALKNKQLSRNSEYHPHAPSLATLNFFYFKKFSERLNKISISFKTKHLNEVLFSHKILRCKSLKLYKSVNSK